MVILLTGPHGTGKTCLAEMLPAALERAYFKQRAPSAKPFPYRYVDCRKTPVSGNVMEEIRRVTELGPPSGFYRNYVVCDEIDNLTPNEQQQLYALTYRPQVVFILTSNHRSKIDDRILGSAIDIILDSPSEVQLKDLALKVATSRNAVLFEHEAIDIARRCNHSWRPVVEHVEAIISARVSQTITLKEFCDRKRIDRYGRPDRPRHSEADYPPQYIDEILISNAESRSVVERLVTGFSRPPPDRAMGILIFGKPHTGRKSLAALLPPSIEQCAYGDNTASAGFSTYVCLSGREGEDQVNEMATLLNQACLETVSHLRYITLIDAERLSIDAQRNLKSLMNRAGAVFILVVNQLTTIDAGILDRCVHRIYLEIPSIEQLRGLLSAALTSSGINPSDELLENVVHSSRSCFLDIYMMIKGELISHGIAEPTHL
jgi:DNA polymerase III delta prime subunit